jgi:hypothetical protein
VDLGIAPVLGSLFAAGDVLVRGDPADGVGRFAANDGLRPFLLAADWRPAVTVGTASPAVR